MAMQRLTRQPTRQQPLLRLINPLIRRTGNFQESSISLVKGNGGFIMPIIFFNSQNL